MASEQIRLDVALHEVTADAGEVAAAEVSRDLAAPLGQERAALVEQLLACELRLAAVEQPRSRQTSLELRCRPNLIARLKPPRPFRRRLLGRLIYWRRRSRRRRLRRSRFGVRLQEALQCRVVHVSSPNVSGL
jgi:hypothetical protein